jgi:hypothetical protein
MSARKNLGLTLLGIASKLAAVRHRRAQIENEEIVYQSDTIPALCEGVSGECLAEMIRLEKIPKNIRVWRRLKDASREPELQAEAARLNARTKELEELQVWIERELADLKSTEAA